MAVPCSFETDLNLAHMRALHMQHYDGGVVMHFANVGISDLLERSNTSPHKLCPCSVQTIYGRELSFFLSAV